jgi:uncharacterized membrane protein
MNAFKSFLKSTVVGGLTFLIPVVLLVLVLKEALQLARTAAVPVAELLPFNKVAGIAVATLLEVALLLLVAFLAGLAARTATGRRMTRWFEDSILGALPQYRMVKTMAEGFAQVENDSNLQPVLVFIDDVWQLAYRMEELHDGWVAVFVPQSPTPMSGNLLFVEATRVRPLDIPMHEALALVKRMGSGAAAVLKSTSLSAAGIEPA